MCHLTLFSHIVVISHKHYGISNHQPLEWLFKNMFKSTSQATSKLQSWHILLIKGQGPDSILRWHLTNIRNPIVKIRWSYDRLISTMGFPILIRWHLYIELGPRNAENVFMSWHHHVISLLYLLLFYIWVRSRNCDCLVTWFYYHLIAKPGNKTATVSWPDPYCDNASPYLIGFTLKKKQKNY